MHSDSQKMGRGLRFSLFAPNARNAHGAHAQACMEFACPMCTHMNPEKAKTTALTAEAAACLYTLCAREKTPKHAIMRWSARLQSCASGMGSRGYKSQFRG